MPSFLTGRWWPGPVAVLVGLAAGPPSVAAQSPTPSDDGQILPRAVLFQPLLADPRWAHFSAALHDYGGDDGLNNVGSVSLGEDFSLYQATQDGGEWGIGLQAGVFAIFDLDAESSDLVNADYWVGVPVAWRRGPWQALARLYHQSSHLGDEFLLRTRLDRVNLSYEGVDVKLSRHLAEGVVRVYGGAGYLLHRIPAELDPWSVQAGVEVRPHWEWWSGALHPVAALDLQSTQEAGWRVGASARLGVELESTRDRDYRVMVAAEYFNGPNPNGQFYDHNVDYWGLGLHVFF